MTWARENFRGCGPLAYAKRVQEKREAIREQRRERARKALERARKEHREAFSKPLTGNYSTIRGPHLRKLRDRIRAQLAWNGNLGPFKWGEW
jgi:hypothetical protein